MGKSAKFCPPLFFKAVHKAGLDCLSGQTGPQVLKPCQDAGDSREEAGGDPGFKTGQHQMGKSRWEGGELHK